MLSEQEQIRREKLNKLKSLGINPFPANLFPLNTNSKEINSNFEENKKVVIAGRIMSRSCLLYTSPSPRDGLLSRMPSSA